MLSNIVLVIKDNFGIHVIFNVFNFWFLPNKIPYFWLQMEPSFCGWIPQFKIVMFPFLAMCFNICLPTGLLWEPVKMLR